MSIAALNWVLGAPNLKVPPLSGPKNSDRLVLIALANHANGEGWAWPGNTIIAGATGLSAETVSDALKRLADSGYVTRVAARDVAALGVKGRTIYRLNFDRETGDLPVSTDADERVNPPPNTGDLPVSDGPTPLPIEPSVTSSAEAAATVVAEDGRAIASWYWDRVKEATGKPPIGLAFMGLAKLADKALKHWSAGEVRDALRAMYRAGITITGQNLDKQLDGRARQRPKSRIDELAELEFDDAGNLIE